MSFDMLANLPLDKLMNIFEKYKNVNVKNVKMKIEKYDNAVVIKVISDSDELGNIVTDLLPIALGNIPKENIEIIDKRD